MRGHSKWLRTGASERWGVVLWLIRVMREAETGAVACRCMLPAIGWAVGSATIVLLVGELASVGIKVECLFCRRELNIMMIGL